MFEFSKKIYSIEECFDILEDTYSDRQIKLLKEDETTFYFQLILPEILEWYVDPDISLLTHQHSLEEIPYFHKLSVSDDKVFLFTFFHSNALLAYEHYKSILSGDSIDILIHYDDHTDMMPIFIPQNTNFNSLSIQNMINKSIIGIGNFVTFFLYKNQNCNMIHVKQNSKQMEKKYIFSQEYTKIGNVNFEKISVIFKNGHNSYQLLNNYSNIVLNRDKTTIWLDIDLDYFYNKFNRDSNWAFSEEHTLNEELLVEFFEKELLKIITSHWFEHVKILTIASSPGFFPVKYLTMAKKIFIKPLYKEYFKNEFIRS